MIEDAIEGYLSLLPSRQVVTGPVPLKPISMQDVRLVAGEGKLPAWAVLQACNTILQQRLPAGPSVTRLADALGAVGNPREPGK